MKRIVPAAAVAALVCLAAMTAYGEAIPEACCACVPASGTQTSGTGQVSGTPAYFCSLGMTAAAEVRCGEQEPPAVLACLARNPGDAVAGSSCREELAAEGIICPAAGAPIAGARGLGLLALVLTGLGAAVLRRRSRRLHG